MKKQTQNIIVGIGAAAMVIMVTWAVAKSTYAPAAAQSTEAAVQTVKLGIDNLETDYSILKDKRVGLITNATGVDSSFNSTIDLLAANTNLTALFAPEHGIRGAADAGETVGGEKDEKTGLPVYSLYGDTRKPTDEMLQNVDVLVYDIQDVGARFYTYISTMKYAMQAAKENNLQFVVLDRPNPINGTTVQGNVLESGFESFIGITHIPQRYGLTSGELAQFMNTEDDINCDLQIVKMSNWKRSMYYDDTGLKCWILPSPNMPTLDTAIVYTGTCVFECTNLSEGRGTTKPFELIGAPWINAQALAEKMNSMNLDGIYFRATSFTPTTSKFNGEKCNGVELHVTDRDSFNAVDSALALMYTIRDMYPNDFQYLETGTIRINTGSDDVQSGKYTLAQLKEKMLKSSSEFKEASKKYYLYEE